MRLLSLAAFALVVLGSDSGTDVSPKDEWSQFRGNALRTGRSAAEIPDELRLVWSFEAGFSIDSSAAIVDGVVYMTALPGLVAALSLEDGSVRWKRDFGEEADRFGESSPTVTDGVVYVGDLLGTLHAFRAADGETLWTFETGSEIKSSAVVVGDDVLISSYDEHLYSLDRKTGALEWKFQAMGPLHSTPAISDGLIYVTGCDSVFRGIRLTDGTEALQFDSGAYTAATPALVDGIAYYGTFNNDVLAVDLKNKKYLWRYEHPERHFPFYSSAAVADGKVIVGGRDKLVHAIDQKTGQGVWTFATGARVESSPVTAGNRVYVGSGDGRFYVLDLASGAKIWEFDAGASIVASPALASGRIVIGSQDGVLYAFGH